MTKDEVVQLHPHIFKQYRNRKEYPNPIAWFGIECGTGWLDIIHRLCSELDEKFPEQVVAHQVKEKFGGLRFYYGCNKDIWEETRKIVSKYTQEANKTCETCGGPGEITNDHGRLRCTCKSCSEERDKCRDI